MNPRDRARRILAWREEQAALEQEGVLAPGDPALAAVRQRHDTMLAGFAAAGDIDLPVSRPLRRCHADTDRSRPRDGFDKASLACELTRVVRKEIAG